MLNETLYFSKENFNDAITVAGEGYVIQLVMQFILIPIIILAFFISPILFIGLSDPELAGLVFIASYAAFMIFAMMIQSLAFSIMLGGQVYTLDRIKKKRKVKFGDVFKYGRKNMFPLIGTFLFNGLIMGGFISIPIITAYIFIITLAPFSEFIFLLFMGLMILATFLIIPFQLSMLPLPFIIRNRLGTGPIASVFEAWKFYIKHLPNLYLMGLFFSMAIIIFSFVPFLNIFVRIAMYPAIIISELIYLDDVLGIQRFRPRYVDRGKMEELKGRELGYDSSSFGSQ